MSPSSVCRTFRSGTTRVRQCCDFAEGHHGQRGAEVDNSLDATHLGTVHAGTFGVADAGFLPPSKVRRSGWIAHTTFEVQYRNYDDPMVETGQHPLVQPQRLYKEIPARRPPSSGCLNPLPTRP